jgi:hypothetical protein
VAVGILVVGCAGGGRCRGGGAHSAKHLVAKERQHRNARKGNQGQHFDNQVVPLLLVRGRRSSRRRTKVGILCGKFHRRTGRAGSELVRCRGVEKADSRWDAICRRRRGHRAVHLRAKASAQITVLAGTGTAAKGVGGIHGARAGGESLQSLFGGVVKAKGATVQAVRRGGSGQNLVIGFLTGGHVDQTVDRVPVGELQRHVARIEQRTKFNAKLVLLLLLFTFLSFVSIEKISQPEKRTMMNPSKLLLLLVASRPRQVQIIQQKTT